MADENNKPKKTKSSLIGNQAQPVVLDKTDKLDIDTTKNLIDNIIDAGITGGLDVTALENFTSMSNSRDQIYQLIDTMCADSSVSSIVRTYAEEVCVPADNGHIVWCESSDPNISKFVNYLLNVMNVDKNIFGWTYCLIKYGDVYLKLYRESDYKDPIFKSDNINNTYRAKSSLHESQENLEENVNLNIHKAGDQYSYYVEMVNDPGSMFELTKYGKTYGYVEVPIEDNGVNYFQNYLSTQNQTISNYKMRSNDVNVYQADDFVHAYLEDGVTRFPEKVDLFLTEADYDANVNAASYTVRRGKSLLVDSYKIWREKSLLEDAVMLNRLTKSSIIRNIQIEVGDMPKSQVQTTLRRVKELFEQKSAVNVGNGMNEYNNPGPIENNIFTATHNGQGAITVTPVGGDIEVKNLGDLDWWNNKFYSSYGIPKQYFGWCLKFDTPILLLDGSTHTIEELYTNKSKYIGKGILGCNSDGSLCPTKITNIILTNPKAKYMRIWLDNDKYVDVTPDHKMMLRDGTFIEARDIVEGDSLMPFNIDNFDSAFVTGNRLVTKIEYFDEEVPVYDITVADDCHTFALPCGIFVHNCDDATGFNGGTSLSILSSVFSKGVKRVQNSMLQAITDIINLILLSKGCRSYLNNFVLKMREPATQEEKDYREALSNRISAISNLQSLFSDIESKPRRLAILKEMVRTLNLGDEIIDQIDQERDATEKAAKEEAAAALAEVEAAGGESVGGDMGGGAPEEPEMPEVDVDLGNSSEAPMAAESFTHDDNKTILTEDNEFLYESDDDLPTPEEMAKNIDFTQNV